jgi:acyl-CoA synthetase (NDP forming)
VSLEHLLEPRQVALVGASPRPGSFGDRLLTELARSPRPPEIHLVNPRHAPGTIAGRPVLASLGEIPEPIDLVLLAVGDSALESVLSAAAERGDRSAVIFGSAVDPSSPADSTAFRDRLAAIATGAGMALCGGGCMGYVSRVVRAIGYLERCPLPTGPIALVTHSGSGFSAMLRTDRSFGYSLAVSSGQELVTTAGEYLDYALSLEETGVVALLLETLRAPAVLQAALSRAAEARIPVVALTVGSSDAGRAMVAAHSGALAGSDAAWEALFDAYGVVRVADLSEMCDTLELLVAGRRVPARTSRRRRGEGGIAAVFDSGAERALAVDVASEVGLRYSEIGPATTKRLAEILDPGLDPVNPLDVWGTGHGSEELFRSCLVALAEDEAVDAVALAVDLVTEYDGDESYRNAVREASAATPKPVCVLSHVPSAIDREAAHRLRSAGVPVLEGTRSGLLALRHLFELGEYEEREAVAAPPPVAARVAAARALSPAELVAAYGIELPVTVVAATAEAAAAAAVSVGFPVVMKTAAPISHKTEAGGVVLGVASPGEAREAYDRLARLGPAVTVSATAPLGVELSVGVVRDPLVGPIIVAAAGGVLVELLSDRAVALPPVDRAGAERMLSRLAVRHLLDGFRGGEAVDLEPVIGAIVALSQLAVELGELVDAVEINPLSCSAAGALALDVLVEWRQSPP